MYKIIYYLLFRKITDYCFQVMLAVHRFPKRTHHFLLHTRKQIIAMSSDATKKRRVGDDDHKIDSGDTASPMISESEDRSTTLAAIMNRMDEMETSKQNESDSMKSQISQLEDKNESLQDSMNSRISSLERSVAILVKEQKWEYSAPDIPRSHWIEAGLDDDDEDDYPEWMEKFLLNMKMFTCQLRNGDGNMCIELGSDDFINDDRVLLHDEVLLPHWNELANALQLYQTLNNSTVIDDLDFYYVQLSASVIDILIPALRRNRVKHFTLENNDFANVREGLEFAVDVIRGNQKMKKLSWVNNRLNNMEGAQLLIDAVSSHPSIDDIRLDGCFGGDGVNGYEVLQSIITSGGDNFTLETTCALGAALKYLTSSWEILHSRSSICHAIT